MVKRTGTFIVTIPLCLGILAIVPAYPQAPAAAPTQDVASLHHQKIYRLMKDMTQVMNKMTEQTSQNILTPEQQGKVAQDMALMSKIMLRMSGLEARPAMKEAEWQKQMDDMRRQMDAMMRSWQTAPGAK